MEGFFEKKNWFFFIIQKVNDRCIHVVQLFVKSCWRQFEMIKLTFREVLYKASIIYEYNRVVCGNGGGINVYIICIVTLFLAEYCGFGWVVPTISQIHNISQNNVTIYIIVDSGWSIFCSLNNFIIIRYILRIYIYI